MLDLDVINFDDLCMALEDHSYDAAWLFDPRTGALHLDEPGVVDEDIDLDDPELIPIDPLPSHEGYGDMEDFISAVTDRRASDLLNRAITGRGAFRRFKDTLYDFPELREQWFTFHDARMRRRAVRWLMDREIVDREAGQAAQDRWPDPPVGGRIPTLASQVTADLKELYGDRLQGTYIVGGHARGDAADDASLDLLVVLDDLDNVWREHDRLDDVCWHHTSTSGVPVVALPVARARFSAPDTPMLVQAVSERMNVA